MQFCALTVDQHKSLYKLVYKNILEDKTFDLKSFSTNLYNKILEKTKNQSLALTYVSYIPSYVSNLQTEDKDFRTVLRGAKVDANDLIDKIDEWENNLPNVAKFLQVEPIESKVEETKPSITKEEAKNLVEQAAHSAEIRGDIKDILMNTFNLSEVEADAVSKIYQRVAETYAKRFNTTPEAFFQTLSFKNGGLKGDALYQLIGEKGAANIDQQTFNNRFVAENMEANGKDAETIFLATGWERGKDGKWRTEVNDGNIRTNKLIGVPNKPFATFKLGDIYNNPQLFKAYPELKDVNVDFDEDLKTGNAIFNGRYISVSKADAAYANRDTLLKSLVHEVQHFVQDKEGFSRGSNAEHAEEISRKQDLEALTTGQPIKNESALSVYKRVAGEVEARNAEARLNLTSEERKIIPFEGTESVARNRQIVVNDNVDNERISEEEAKKIEEERSQIEARAKEDGTYLKAPNGEHTKLSPKDWVTVRTTNFKNWFGDWENDPKNSSQIVDDNGEPLVMIHASDSNHEVFDRKKIDKVNTGQAKGFHFSSSKFDLKRYGKNLYYAFLNVRNPKGIYQERHMQTNVITNDMDGAIHRFETRSGSASDVVVYDPNQIKSVDNVGTFSTEDNNIKLQRERGIARGAVQIAEDGKAVIYALTNPNVSTPLHELAHVWEQYLTEEERNVVLDWIDVSPKVITDENGNETLGERVWDRSVSEEFAKGFEKYLTEGNASDFSLQIIFDRFAQWLTDIYKGIFGSEVDLKLNDAMRKVYSQMLGTNFRERTLQEIQAENDKRSDAQKVADKVNRDIEIGSDFLKPIPADSAIYWSHLSNIQQAFINNRYDKFLSESKITEEQLREIINSTKSAENEGLGQALVDQVVFRVGNQDLINDSEYWKTTPEVDSDEYKTLKNTIWQIAHDGSFAAAVANGVIKPQEAKDILAFTKVLAVDVEKEIKKKEKENEGLEEQADTAKVNAVAPNQVQLKEVRKIAKSLVKKGNKSGFVLGLANAETDTDLIDGLKSVAEQYNDPGTREATVKALGENITKIAADLFPNAVVEPENDLLAKIEALDNITDQDIDAIEEAENAPEAPKAELSIQQGDLVEFKGERHQVAEIIHGETAEDTMYLLDNGQMKFSEQLKLVQTEDEYNKAQFEATNNIVFSSILEEEGKTNHELVSKEESEADKETLNYLGLKTILERLKNKFGLDYEVVSTNEDFKGRFSNGKVIVNLKKFDNTTPFHEYLHPFVEVLKKENSALYVNLAKELGSSERGKQIISEIKNDSFYKTQTAEEIGDEALVRYISEESAKNVNKEGRRIKETYVSNLQRLVKRFQQWLGTLWSKLGGMVVDNFAKIPTEATLEDVVDMVSLHEMRLDIASRKELVNTLDKYQKEANADKTYESKIIDRIKRKLAVLEHTGRERINSDELVTEVIRLRTILKNQDESESLYNYMEQAFFTMDRVNSSFTHISKKLFASKGELTKPELLELSKDLEVIKQLIVFYKEAEDYFQYSADDLSKEDVEYYSKVLTKNKGIISRIQNTSIDLVSSWLFPYIERYNEKIKATYPERVISKEAFKNSLYTANGDIDAAFYLLGSISSSKDNFSGVVRSALYDLTIESHLADVPVIEGIKSSYAKFLQDKGLSNNEKGTTEYYKNNYMRKAVHRVQTGLDENKQPIFAYKEFWAFHQKYMYDLFDKDRTDYMENEKVFGKDGFDDSNQDHINKLISWEKTNAKQVQVGTEVQKQDIFDENGKKIGSEDVTVPIYKLEPSDKYINPSYNAVQNDAHFKKLEEIYNSSNEKLGSSALKYGIVPQVSKGKSIFADYKDKSVLDKIKTFGKNTRNFFLTPEADEDQTSRNVENLDGSKHFGVSRFYTQLLEEEDLDLRLPETVLQFSSKSTLTSLKQEIDPLVRITKSLLEDNPKLGIEARRIAETTFDNKTKFDRIFKLPANKEKQQARLNGQLSEFINDVMYGVSHQEAVADVFGKAVDLNKLGQNWSFLTALNNMALNINGAISNVLVGNVQSFIESTGGRYFNKANWTKGEGVYFKNLNNFLKDQTSLKKSLITELAIKYDALQGEFRDKNGKKFVGNAAARFNTNALFALNHIGEHQIQLTAMLAMMDNKKVKTTDGQELSLIDAHEINKDGYLRLKPNVIWSKQDDFDFTKLLQGVNKSLNGNYSDFDRAVLQRRWYGKLALIYRKYIYTSYKARFGKAYDDFEINNVNFGYQRKFFNKLVSDIKEYKFDAAANFFKRKGWTADERYAYNKTLTELGLLAGMFALTALLSAGDDKDKDNSKVRQAALLYIFRLRRDISMFTIGGVVDVYQILQNPSAVMITMQKYADFFAQLVSDASAGKLQTYTRKTGVFQAGEAKLKAKLFKAMPIVRQVVNFLSPDEQLAFYKLK